MEDALIRRESDNLTFGKHDGVNTNKVSVNSIVSPLPPQNLDHFFDYNDGEEPNNLRKSELVGLQSSSDGEAIFDPTTFPVMAHTSDSAAESTPEK